MPETPPSNSQLLLSRKKSTDSKPPSCSERPLTLFHTAQPNEKRKCPPDPPHPTPPHPVSLHTAIPLPWSTAVLVLMKDASCKGIGPLLPVLMGSAKPAWHPRLQQGLVQAALT